MNIFNSIKLFWICVCK